MNDIIEFLKPRLDELSALRDGWLDGAGTALDPDGVRWFGNSFERYYGETLILPRLYPTVEGGIQAEWTCEKNAVSLEINLATKKAAYQAMDTDTLDCTELEIDLSSENGWKTLNGALAQVEGMIA